MINGIRLWKEYTLLESFLIYPLKPFYLFAFHLDIVLQYYKMGSNVKNNIVLFCLDYDYSLSIGKNLADRFQMYFLDIQGLYEFDIKPRTLTETIREGGIERYRHEIQGAIKYVSTFDNALIAIESGAVLNPINVQRLKEHSLVVYIRKLPKWSIDSKVRVEFRSKEEEKLYKIKDSDVASRDRYLCEVADIIAYGYDGDDESYIKDIIKKIERLYGV